MTYRQSQEKQELAAKLKTQLNGCSMFSPGTSQAFKQAYDYYFQRPRGDEIAGRSSIVTGDLSSMVEANLAQMTEPLMSRRIAEFCSYSAEDEEQSQLETDCVTEMLFKRQNGYIEVVSAVKDALLVRNGIVKVYVDKRTYKRTVTKKNVDPVAVVAVLDQIGNADVHSYDPESRTLRATVTKETQKFTVRSVAPENFLVSSYWNSHDIDGIPFCAERHIDSRSTLIEYGFNAAAVEVLPKYAGQDITGRQPRDKTETRISIDASQDSVEWYECYVLMDDGHGASQLHVIALAGDYILDDDDEAAIVCYATGTAIINPHCYTGISLHDKIKSTQDSSTALTRGLMDNLNAVNKNRTAHLDGIVEADDLQDGRINGSIRVNPTGIQDVRQAITAFGVQDTSGNILQNLEHMRRVRSEMGGASLDMATGQMQLNDRLGSQGLDRAYSVMEQLAAFMMRNIAQTLIRSMYLVGHEVLRTQWRGAISFKRNNVWIQQDPSKWMVREAVDVNLGKTAGERARMALVYEKIMAKQEALAANGMEGILVDVNSYHTAFMDWMRVSDITVPERYVIDPRSDASKQAMKDRALQKQADAKKQDALMQQAIALEQLRVAFQKYQTDQDTQFKYYQVVLNAQIEEAKITADKVVDLLKAKSDAEAAKGKADESGTTKAIPSSAAKQSAAA